MSREKVGQKERDGENGEERDRQIDKPRKSGRQSQLGKEKKIKQRELDRLME